MDRHIMQTLKQPLTNTQLELLRAFSHQLSEEEVQALRQLLAAFFAQRAIRYANQAWEENNWSDETVDKILETKLRAKKK